MNTEEKLRQLAIQRYLKGESPKAIYGSLKRSKSWFFKWLDRFNTGLENWYEDQPRTPETSPNRTPDEIVEIVKMVRLELYNQDLFHGAQAIRWRLEDLGVNSLNSVVQMTRVFPMGSVSMFPMPSVNGIPIGSVNRNPILQSLGNDQASFFNWVNLKDSPSRVKILA